MIVYVWLYHFHNLLISSVLRIVIYGVLLYIVYSQMSLGVFPKIPLFFALLFLNAEVFFAFKIARIKPNIKAKKNDGKDIISSFTLQALEAYMLSPDTKHMLAVLIKRYEVRFLMLRAGIEDSDIAYMGISKEEVAKKAFELSKNTNGMYVRSMDLFAAYILLSEKNSHSLYNKNLHEADLLNILLWTRQYYIEDELPKSNKILFFGQGFGEGLVSGWTPETQKYTRDLTTSVLRGELVLAGRTHELTNLIESMSKFENNNALLIGEPGSGKTTLVEAIAYKSFTEALPGRIQHKRFLELMVGELLAGATNQSDLEARLQAILEEVTHANNIVLYIPEFQNIIGASTFHVDLSAALLPHLRSGNLPIIGTITVANYKTFVESKLVLQDKFHVVKLEQPSPQDALEMLFEKVPLFEKKYRVFFTYLAVKTALEGAISYVADSVLPGSAIRILMDTAASISLTKKGIVTQDDIIQTVEEKTHISVGKPKQKEKETLLHLEEALHQRVIGQQQAISAISQAMRRFRSGLSSPNKPISFLFLGPTGVGKTETAKALADVYFGDDKNMIRLDMSEYSTEEGVKRLLGVSPGEGDSRGELTDLIRDNPFSLVLLDEFEKANPKILDLFLQVFDDGRLTDNKGHTVSFANSIIIATSNAASEYIRQQIKTNMLDSSFQKELPDYLESKQLFRPELLNRFDGIIVFKPLGKNEAEQITRLLLKKTAESLAKKDITVSFDQSVIEKIVSEGTNEEFGARPLRRYIQNNIEAVLAARLLEDSIKRGDTIKVGIDQSGAISLTAVSSIPQSQQAVQVGFV